MLRALVFSALLLVVVSAQRPSRCVSPSQWESRLIEIEPSKKFERRANISYDATNMRIRTIDEVEEGSTRDFYDEISLYKKKVHYSVNLKTKQCNKTALDKPFRPIEVPVFANFTDSVYLSVSGLVGAGVLEDVFQGNVPEGATLVPAAIHEVESEGQQRDFYDEIALYEKKVMYRFNRRTRECTTTPLTTPFRSIEVPPNATYYGTYYVGSTSEPLAGFKVNSFGGDTENGRYVGTWSYVDCVPVTDAYIGGQTGFVHWSFFDVVLGIDPDVFIPPTECLQ